jgi:hypothetical protein
MATHRMRMDDEGPAADDTTRGQATFEAEAAPELSVVSDASGQPLTHEHPTPEEIAAEAYAIYVRNGHRDGYHVDDWLEAERQLRERGGSARPRQLDPDDPA